MNFLDPGGIVVPRDSLQIPRAKGLAEIVEARNYVSFVECRQRADGKETVIIDVRVQVPQVCVHDVLPVERIAVTFKAEDDWYPEVLALRGDFPEVPHTNLQPAGAPRSLCLYEDAWDEVALRWTPPAFVEEIRSWLALTAIGKLHQADQQLEPLIFGSGCKIVLPNGFFEDESTGYQEIKLLPATNFDDCKILIAEKGKAAVGVPMLAMSFVTNPQQHGVIRHDPASLQDLANLTRPAGLNIVEALIERLPDWNTKELRNKKVMFLIAFPMTREGSDQIERFNPWVFATTITVAELGKAIGLWGDEGGAGLGQVLSIGRAADASKIAIEALSPVFGLSRDKAAAASGFSPDTRNVVIIGVGSLGSQVAMLLAKSGFGKWCLIDEDALLPHNVARHAIDADWIGWPKAFTVGREIFKLYPETEQPTWIEANIRRPGKESDRINEQLKSADLLLEMSASPAVAKHLCYKAESSARRMSLFLNPRGNDLVMLAEDEKRELTLDALEMAYYRAVINDKKLQGHLSPPTGRIRFARSCRDVSATIPNHLVSLHASIGAKAVRDASSRSTATAQVWHCDPETLEVRRIVIKPAATTRISVNGWTLVFDQHVKKTMTKLREEKLPNETGGVLIGSYNMSQKIVYVADVIRSPQDSKESPDGFIRGYDGLLDRCLKIREDTARQIEYLGEWHSHPNNCSVLPSNYDLALFAWLQGHMSAAGQPAVMAIIGENQNMAWFIDTM